MGSIHMTVADNGIDAMLNAVSDIPKRAQQALQAGADVLLPAVTEAAPVRSTGEHIKSRMGVKITGAYERASAQVGALNAPIAHLVEQGHGGPHPAPAHPFFEPAAESVEDAVMAAITEVLLQ